MSFHLPALTQELVRAQFPALKSGFGFFENAGGAQVPQCVIDAMTRFMQESYVQFGSSYEHSARCSKVAREARAFYNLLFNGEDSGDTVLGPSTTALTHMLAGCFRRALHPGDEVVVSIANHEANATPWTMLEREGVVVKLWGVDPVTGASSLEELESLLTDRTKVVAFPVTSNLLGDTMPVRKIADMAHRVGARVVVDAVAFASHQAMDVQAWDADFCVFSNYKVYGPHIAGMWGKREAWLELDGPNHFFIPRDQIPTKFELGCVSYEALAGVLAFGEYLRFLSGSTELNRETVVAGFAQMKRLEEPVTRILLEFLNSRDDIRLVGPTQPDPERHPTISFVHKSKPSNEISAQVNQRDFGIRHGHMYSMRLCEALGISGDPGLVRVSAVHYNTPEEAHRLAKALESAMP